MPVARPEDFYAPADGIGDDAPGLAAALATGHAELCPHKTYCLHSTVAWPSTGARLIGNGARILVKAQHFNNNNPYKAGDPRIAAVNSGPGGWELNTTGRYGANAVVLEVRGRNSRLHDVVFEGDGGAGLMRTVVFAKDTDGFCMSDCEVSGIGMGFGALLAACRDYTIENNKFRDLVEEGTFPSVAAGDAANCAPNVTAISTTDDFVASHGVSRGGRISNNRIDNIRFSGAGLARHGDQSDGINLAQMCQFTRFQICGNHISNVAEGLDIFEQFGLISGNHIVGCGLFGAKLTYGAAFNMLSDNVITHSGKAAIVLDSPAGYETRNNVGIGNLLHSAAGDDSALIRLSAKIATQAETLEGKSSGSTHSNTFSEGQYNPVAAPLVIRNTANVGNNPSNRVSGRLLGTKPLTNSTAGLITNLYA